jgi:hypothetical protein
MPPELSADWIADCASASQFDPVLEAIEGVAARVERSDAPAVEAEDVPPLLPDVEPPDDKDDALVSEELCDGGL